MRKQAMINYSTGLCFFALFVLLLNPCLSFAGAWTAPKGQTYNRLALNSYYADEIFNDSGDSENMPENGDFSDRNISYYLEHGLMDQLTLIFSASCKYLQSEDNLQKSDNYAFSDIDLGLRYRLAQGKYGVISFQSLVKIPEAYGDKEEIPPGNGQYDLSMKLQYGRSLYPVIPGYYNLEAGYKYRDKEPADEFIYLLELGVDITKKIYARIKYDAIIGMDNADKESSVNNNPSSASDYDLAKVDLAFGYKFNKAWAMELETLKEVSGESVSKGITYTLAFSLLLP